VVEQSSGESLAESASVEASRHSGFLGSARSKTVRLSEEPVVHR
jgi:hypothetical protein